MTQRPRRIFREVKARAETSEIYQNEEQEILENPPHVTLYKHTIPQPNNGTYLTK